MSLHSDDWHIVRPEGLALILLCVTAASSVCCSAIVSLRFWVRFKAKTLGSEDWLMATGLVRPLQPLQSRVMSFLTDFRIMQGSNLAQNGVVMYGSLTGLGTPDSKLNTAQSIRGGMVSSSLYLLHIFLNVTYLAERYMRSMCWLSYDHGKLLTYQSLLCSGSCSTCALRRLSNPAFVRHLYGSRAFERPLLIFFEGSLRSVF